MSALGKVSLKSGRWPKMGVGHNVGCRSRVNLEVSLGEKRNARTQGKRSGNGREVN